MKDQTATTACEEPLTRQLGAVVCWSSPQSETSENRKERQRETKDRFKTLQSISDLTQG